MAPLESRASLLEQNRGVYAGSIEIPMPLTWETKVFVRCGAQPLGSVRTTKTAR
jgi:hypothetical protein